MTNEEVLARVNEALRRVQRGDQLRRRLLDITDAAHYLSMSDKGVRELVQSGALPYIQRVPGRSPYLLDTKDLDAWVEKTKERA